MGADYGHVRACRSAMCSCAKSATKMYTQSSAETTGGIVKIITTPWIRW